MKRFNARSCTYNPRLSTTAQRGVLALVFIGFLLPIGCLAQQPAEPVNINPIDGETYYLINQLSGLQMDLDNGSTSAGASILIANRSLTSLSQRWALTKVTAGDWVISNLSNGLCLDSSTSGGATATVQNPCAPATATQQWALTATSNGYCTLANASTGLVLDVSGGSSSAGAALNQTTGSASPAQSQQWLLRPVFFRGIDNALLEKQEADRLAAGLPWWQDAGQTEDVLEILKNHGVNLIRIRPASVPPYQTYTLSSPASALPATCSTNGCYAETDSADIDLAKRAKQLGLSVELTLFFDGGSSQATPGLWTSYSLVQAQTAVYNYVKSEVEAYRSAGVMPDMVTVGNEVDTGFFGSLASPSSSNFGPFAALQIQGMQAVLDAASDTTPGPAIPAPLRCIHITPAWDLTSFFTLVNSNNIPYDAICQSYYPIYHGPLTVAQAAASNPDNQPVEQTVLSKAASTIGKPIFLIEAGEHYENGFDSNDPWYPSTIPGQRQFLIDLNGVLKGLPSNLGMGFDYWDAAGVNTATTGSGYTNGNGGVNATYVWNGLTIFDNADTTGSSLSTAANYSAVLESADGLGGKIDSTLSYKLVNVASGNILEISGAVTQSATPLDTATSNGRATPAQQWSITSNGDGSLQFANLGTAQGATAQVLDNDGSSASGAVVVLNAAASGTTSQEWNLVTAGNGAYTIVNKQSGLVLSVSGTGAGSIQQQSPASTSLDWITPMNQSQLWQVTPVHITAAAPAAAASSTVLTASSALVNPGQSVTLTATVTSAAGTPSGTVTFFNGSTQLGTANLNGSGAGTYSGMLAPGVNPLSADYAGTTAFAPSDSSTVTVTEPDYSLTSNLVSLTVTAGSNASVSLTVTPVGGYNGSVGMSCATALAGVTCSFSPASYALDGSNTAVNGTVSINASSTAGIVYPHFNGDRSNVAVAGILWLPGLIGLLLLSFEPKGLSRSPRRKNLFLLLALLAAGASLSACGGAGGGGGGSPPPVTGTVTISAAGSTGSVSQSVKLTVTVD